MIHNEYMQENLG